MNPYTMTLQELVEALQAKINSPILAFDEDDRTAVFFRLMGRRHGVKEFIDAADLMSLIFSELEPALEWLNKNNKIVSIQQIKINTGMYEWGTVGDFYAKITLHRVEDVVLFKMFCL